MNKDIEHTVQLLQSEVQYVVNTLATEKDEKKKAKMLKQLNVIGGVLGKLFEIKSNAQYYRQ